MYTPCGGVYLTHMSHIDIAVYFYTQTKGSIYPRATWKVSLQGREACVSSFNIQGLYIGFPKIVGFPPKSSILIGFSVIFTIHFGGPHSFFGNTHIFQLYFIYVYLISLQIFSTEKKNTTCCLLTKKISQPRLGIAHQQKGVPQRNSF